MGWNLNNSTTFLLPNCTPPKCGELSEYTDSAHTEVEDPSSRCINGSDVGGLPISQDGLDKMKLVLDRTIPIVLPSGKNLLVNMENDISLFMILAIKMVHFLGTQYFNGGYFSNTLLLFS